MDTARFIDGFNRDMEILFIHKNLYLHLWIILLSFVIRGEKRQLIPSFIPQEITHVVVHRGDTAVLKCKIRNLGPKSVAWRKVSEYFPLSVGKMMYAPNDEMSIDYHESDSITNINLIIKQAKPSHSGTYECQISAALVYTYHVNLTVLSEPRVRKSTISLTGSQYLNAYQRLNLTCNATGPLRAPEVIDWFHEGNLIDNKRKQWQDRVVITKYVPEVPGKSLISQLTLERVQFEDAGIYVCRSSSPNLKGDVETTSIEVHVLGAGDNINKSKREDDNTNNQSQQQFNSNYSTGPRSSCIFTLFVAIIQTLR